MHEYDQSGVREALERIELRLDVLPVLARIEEKMDRLLADQKGRVGAAADQLDRSTAELAGAVKDATPPATP